MLQPAQLHPGDRVAIVATARKVSSDEIEPARQLLRSWDLEVVIPDGLYAEHHQLAGDDAHRARLLQRCLDDPSLRALFCARGGYGTVRIIDRLDLRGLARTPKWIVGYSDVTVLHSHLHRILSLPTLHATMPINIHLPLSPTPATTTLRHALFASQPLTYTFSTATEVNRAGQASAPVVGGNLSILYSLLGSPSDIDTDGKILFIEDLDEYLYHIDRMMQALRRAGKLRNLRALIVGQFTDLHDNAIPFGATVEEIVLDAVGGTDYPVCFNAPFGHSGDNNCALPLGIEASLAVTPRSATLTFPTFKQ